MPVDLRLGQIRAWPLLVLGVFALLFIYQSSAMAASTVKMWAWMTPQLEADIVKAIRTRFPEINFELTTPSTPVIRTDDVAKLISSGEYDLILTFSMERYLSHLLPLDSFIARDRLDTTKYLGNIMPQMKVQDQAYELPVYVEPRMVLFNRGLFNARGVAYPKADWTWEDFRQIAARLNEKGTPRSYGAVSDWSIWHLMLSQIGSNVRTLDDKAYIDTFDFLLKLVRQDESLLISIFDPAVSSAWDPTAQFRNGEAAMQFSAHLFSPDARVLGVAPLPRWSHEARATYATVGSVAIPKNAKSPHDAWRIASFLAGPAGADIMAANGRLPALISSSRLQAWVTAYTGGIVPIGLESFATLNLVIPSRTNHTVHADFQSQRLFAPLSLLVQGRMSPESILAGTLEAKRRAASQLR